MFGGGLTWFSRVLAGVDTDPAEPGFRHVIVRPMPVAALESVSYSTETPYGKVRSSVSHDGQKVTVEVQVPVGAHATVYVPKSVAETAAEPLDNARYEVHEVGSGTYRFTSGE
jgi:alpha-L-rhamnosidase